MPGTKRKPAGLSAGRGEDAGEEVLAEAHAFVVDAVAEARAEMRLNGYSRRLESGHRLGQGVDGENRVGVAVGQQDRRPGYDLPGEQVGAGQHAREAEDAGQRPGPARAHVQRHDSALGKADQHQLVLGQPVLGQLGVDEGVEDGRRRPGAGEAGLGGEVLEAEPLEAGGRHVEGKGCVGRDDEGAGQGPLKERGQPDQVVAVGADAVQQNGQLFGRPAGGGLKAGAVQGRKLVHYIPFPLGRELITGAIIGSMMACVTRFAPSPTGLLHLGHAHSALFAEAAARRAGGRFLLRLEDIDPGRCRAAFEEAIYEDLGWLGLEWEEPVRRQSVCMGDYARALGELDAKGLLYPCFCTRKEIAEEIGRAVQAPHGPDGPVYPGVCRAMSTAERRQRMAAGEPRALRLDMGKAAAAAGELAWTDGDKGTIAAAPEIFGDVVLARKDVPASYHLSCTLDDHLQYITLVTRGEDLFAATHVHRLLQHILGLAVPQYHHHRLIAGEDGARLAKRHRAPSLRALREAGKTPGEVREMAGFPARAFDD